MQRFVPFSQLKTTSWLSSSFLLSALQTHLKRSERKHTQKAETLWFNYLYLVSVWVEWEETHAWTQSTHIITMTTDKRQKEGNILRLWKVGLWTEMRIKAHSSRFPPVMELWVVKMDDRCTSKIVYFIWSKLGPIRHTGLISKKLEPWDKIWWENMSAVCIWTMKHSLHDFMCEWPNSTLFFFSFPAALMPSLTEI